MNIYIYLFVTWLCTALFSADAHSGPDTVTDRYIAQALQGDVSNAGTLFRDIATEPEPSPARELASRFESRFIAQDEDLSPGTGDSWADAVVAVYRQYWTLTLTGALTRQAGSSFLSEALLQLLAQLPGEEHPVTASAKPGAGPDVTSDIFAQIGVLLAERGFHYLETPAPPLRDLFLWKREETTSYRVRLTDRTQPVRVTFMTDIYSLGWKHFATLDLVATTGWIDGDRLYCVSSAYDRFSENFRVSYLKHESRHLADYERFPGLPSVELEYRAKLTELAFASLTQISLLDDFALKSAPNSESPHALANYRVTRDLHQALFGVPWSGSGDPWRDANTSAVAKTARELLRQNTERLEAGSR